MVRSELRVRSVLLLSFLMQSSFAASLLDTSFNARAGPNLGPDGVYVQLRGIALQPGGKVVAIGNFTQFNGRASDGITRLHGDGRVDTNFVASRAAQYGEYVDARKVTVAADGKILIAGNFSSFRGKARSGLVRLGPDGTVDESFSFLSNRVSGISVILVQADGRIVIAGEKGMDRLLEDGTEDPSFSRSGVGGQTVTSAALLDEGRIVVGTLSTNGEPALLRLNSDGLVDSSFTPTSGLFGAVYKPEISTIVPLTAGKLLVAGSFLAPRGGVARLNSDGSLDRSFDAAWVGRVATAVARPDGKIVIGGLSVGTPLGTQNGVMQLLPDGAIDLGFDVRIEQPEVTDLILQPDSKVLVGGNFSTVDGIERLRIARLKEGNATNRNVVVLQCPWFVAENGGKIRVEVLRIGNREGEVTVRCATADGSARANVDYRSVSHHLVFGPGEWIKSFEIEIFDNAIADQDRTFTVLLSDALMNGMTNDIQMGFSSQRVSIYDEEPGVTFFEDHYVVTESAEFAELFVGLTQRPQEGTVDYEIIEDTAKAGRDFLPRDGTLQFSDWWQDSAFRTLLVRLVDDDTVDGDRHFRVRLKNPTGGLLLGPISNVTVTILDNDNLAGAAKGLNGSVQSSTSLPDGRLVIGGWFTAVNGVRRFHVARLEQDGSADLSFDTSDGPDGPVLSVGAQPDGKIIIGGRFSSVGGVRRGRVARLNGDGTLDLSFQANPGWQGQMSHYGPVPEEIRAIAIQPDGKILTAGTLTNYNGAVRFGLARLNTDGSLDESFHPPGTNGTGIRAVALQPDGRIIIGGAFRGSNLDYIARLNSNGTLDETFKTTIVSRPNSFWLDGDGKILAATDWGMIALNGDGSAITNWAAALVGDRITCFLPQPNGTLWIGGKFASPKANVIEVSREGTFRTILKDEGLVRTLSFQGNIIFAGGTFNGIDSEDMDNQRRNPVFGAIILGNQPNRFFWKQVSLDGTLVSNLRFERLVAHDGEVDLSLAGQAKGAFVVERTEDLKNWSPVSTNSSPNSGMVLRDVMKPVSARRFYRARNL